MPSDDPHSDLAINWLQARFTKRDDGKFVGAPIRTTREFQPVDSSESTFTLKTIETHLS